MNEYREEYIEKKSARLKDERDKLNDEINNGIKDNRHLSKLSEEKKSSLFRKKIISEFYSEESAEIKQMLLEQYKLIKALIATNVIFPKYNNVVAWNTMYEYFLTGRVSELSGPNGAYNLYENELRSNTIISKLDTVIDKLDTIKDTQYLLYQLINETNNTVKCINDYVVCAHAL